MKRSYCVRTTRFKEPRSGIYSTSQQLDFVLAEALDAPVENVRIGDRHDYDDRDNAEHEWAHGPSKQARRDERDSTDDEERAAEPIGSQPDFVAGKRPRRSDAD